MNVRAEQIELDGLSPIEVFLRLPKNTRGLSFLASDGTVESRWSILTWDPVKTVASADELKAILAERKRKAETELPFIGGGIGSIDYELGYHLLDLPCPSANHEHLEWSFYDSALVYDHQKGVWWGIGEGNHAFVEIIHELSLQKSRISLTPSWDFRRYQTAFAQLKENIRIGEIYQTCLSFPFFGEAVESPRALFAQLFQKNPAPMAAYLEQSNRTVLSLSPERFIVWDGHTIETMPIKGTRPRGKTPEQDRAIKEDLLRNEKERAELNMITDLLRNDLAKVCKPGSVKVHELRAIQECPNVWHAYSHIVGESKEGILAWDIVEAMFPGGSISGCPKRRAVEILTELESQARGIYTGCIGMISDHGRMDLNIAIRTLEQSAERIQASFGGGIVYDSVAEREYQEIFDKAKPFLS